MEVAPTIYTHQYSEETLRAYIYIYIHAYIHVYMYIYMYIYRMLIPS